jgi:hypothetical protein
MKEASPTHNLGFPRMGDCGLKTRGWEETKAALKNMIEAARQMRTAAVPQAVARS